MKMPTEVIMSCPFCGSRAVNVVRTNAQACWVECDACNAQTTSDALREGAIKQWNRRCLAEESAKVVWDDDLEWQVKNGPPRVKRSDPKTQSATP